MGATIIARGRLKGQFLTMVERLFPEDLDRIERRLEAGRREPRFGSGGPAARRPVAGMLAPNAP